MNKKQEIKFEGWGRLFRAVFCDFDWISHRLTPHEYKILEMRFGLEDNITHTLEEVGREFGVTRERIRQIEAKAIEKIRKPL